ncbi:class I SAM-dependent methyltransferase [Nocardia sp. CDC160]|uniref:class I SAM-dependent methyltransferase n=1 Tax=Nocardia sp. CDC160 TaxID=3112166 RepID=UPI002DB8690F|nr:class I SAM-dependent methyltransferase [Nocardia sp. CDC160]MEC3915611.1 class I SAM-dependent methyltransferase [Nocardia sp. CDC160]
MSTTTSGEDRSRLALTPVEETLVIPLYGRAVETRKPRGLLRDDSAVRIVDGIDYDFGKFDGGPSLIGTVVRTCIFDAWAREFLTAHPAATVIELGAGLSSRFDRLDNGSCHWFDLDLPEVIELRRRYFAESDRSRMIAASVLDPAWFDEIAQAPGPYLFLAEGMLMYLEEAQVLEVLSALVERFPGSSIAFDTCGRKMIDTQDRHDSLSKMTARMRWACDDPATLNAIGLTLRDSRTLARPQADIRRALPRRQRWMMDLAARLNLRDFANYRVNLFEITRTAGESR